MADNGVLLIGVLKVRRGPALVALHLAFGQVPDARSTAVSSLTRNLAERGELIGGCKLETGEHHDLTITFTGECTDEELLDAILHAAGHKVHVEVAIMEMAEDQVAVSPPFYKIWSTVDTNKFM